MRDAGVSASGVRGPRRIHIGETEGFYQTDLVSLETFHSVWTFGTPVTRERPRYSVASACATVHAELFAPGLASARIPARQTTCCRGVGSGSMIRAT